MSHFIVRNKAALLHKHSWLKKVLGLSFLFFLIKGMFWLLLIAMTVVSSFN